MTDDEFDVTLKQLHEHFVADLRVAAMRSTQPVAPAQKRRARFLAVAAVALTCVVAAFIILIYAPPAPTEMGAETTAGRPPKTVTTTPLPATTTAVPTTLPNLVGMDIAHARDQLPVSATVVIEDVFSNGERDGTVVGQSPAAGAPINGPITLTVARPAYTVYLDSLHPYGQKDGLRPAGDSLGIIGMTGKSFMHSVIAPTEPACTAPMSTEYNLDRKYRRLTSTAGISDSSERSDIAVMVEVFVDGTLISTQEVSLGNATNLDVDLTNALRMKIQWRVISPPTSCRGNTFALGEPMLHSGR